MAYWPTAISSFPKAVLVTCVLGLTFLPVALFSRRLLSNPSRCSILKDARPEQFPDKVPVDSDLSPSSSFSDRCRREIREWSVFLRLQFLSSVQSLLSFEQWSAPQESFDTRSSIRGRIPDCSLHDLQPNGFPEDPAGYPLLPQR
jgi:hypothetical protein